MPKSPESSMQPVAGSNEGVREVGLAAAIFCSAAGHVHLEPSRPDRDRSVAQVIVVP